MNHGCCRIFYEYFTSNFLLLTDLGGDPGKLRTFFWFDAKMGQMLPTWPLNSRFNSVERNVGDQQIVEIIEIHETRKPVIFIRHTTLQVISFRFFRLD